jgi:hypothetical protein
VILVLNVSKKRKIQNFKITQHTFMDSSKGKIIAMPSYANTAVPIKTVKEGGNNGTGWTPNK